jgi:hypothetical protein
MKYREDITVILEVADGPDVQIPGRTYKGRRRIAKKYSHDLTALEPYIKLRVGDYVMVCDGFNRQIKEIEYVWNIVGRKTWVLTNVCIIDDAGTWHSAQSCYWPLKEANEHIRERWQYWLNLPDEEAAEGTFAESFRERARKYFAFGNFLTPNGELRPELK